MQPQKWRTPSLVKNPFVERLTAITEAKAAASLQCLCKATVKPSRMTNIRRENREKGENNGAVQVLRVSS